MFIWGTDAFRTLTYLILGANGETKIDSRHRQIRYVIALVPAELELVFFLVAGIVLWFGVNMRIMLRTR